MKKAIAWVGLLFVLGFVRPAMAQDALPQFPGIKTIPVLEDPQWAEYFRAHQPVKVVFGVSDPKAQLQESLTNAALIIRDLKANKVKYKIQFVLYGNAVLAADSFGQKYASYSDLMQSLHAQGVEFRVCYNSLYSLHKDPSDVYSYMKVIPAG
ncbi:MAG: DsrE family protein, partial [Gammaproteobacteria bacterium]